MYHLHQKLSPFAGSIDTNFTGITTTIEAVKNQQIGVNFQSGLAEPEINKSTGKVIYIDNRSLIERDSRQKEDVKIILELKKLAQKTNLNIGPYYDDFDSQNNFYKVLFKPGYPVQSRELTTLQSIIQNQVEDFGSFIFKEGFVVVPGNIGYDSNFFAVKLNPTQFGINLSLYIENFLLFIVGDVTGITVAKVRKVVLPDESNGIEYITLYLQYLDSDQNFEFTEFEDGESLIVRECYLWKYNYQFWKSFWIISSN